MKPSEYAFVDNSNKLEVNDNRLSIRSPLGIKQKLLNDSMSKQSVHF